MYFFPVTEYGERATIRTYSKQVVPVDSENFACGDAFEGFHTGDDLEVSEREKQQEIPVHAIADGTIRQKETVGGYGGLMVIEHQLGNETVTAYYGHIDLASSPLNVGDTVHAGQFIANLGDDCSEETSNERKHLHFAIREGSAIDVRGYVQNREELSAWRNPEETLQSLNAYAP